MPTPDRRTGVSIASLAIALGLLTVLAAGCTRTGTPVVQDAPAPRASFRFDNEAETYVDVYLVSEQQTWRLGRVAPGARTDLRIPEGAVTASNGFLRLAVLAGAPLSLQPASDPNAILTIAQPLSALLSQRWTYAFAPGGSPQIVAARTNGRP